MTVFGLGLQLNPDEGEIPVVKLTVSVKPEIAPVVTVVVPVTPGSVVTLVGLAKTEKSDTLKLRSVLTTRVPEVAWTFTLLLLEALQLRLGLRSKLTRVVFHALICTIGVEIV